MIQHNFIRQRKILATWQRCLQMMASIVCFFWELAPPCHSIFRLASRLDSATSTDPSDSFSVTRSFFQLVKLNLLFLTEVLVIGSPFPPTLMNKFGACCFSCFSVQWLKTKVVGVSKLFIIIINLQHCLVESSFVDLFPNHQSATVLKSKQSQSSKTEVTAFSLTKKENNSAKSTHSWC